LTERQYLTYLSGSIFSTQGLWIQRMTIGWMMWEFTRSETWLGALAFLMFFPTVIFGPLFGVMVDRVNRQRAAIMTSIILAIISAALATLVYFKLDNQYLLLMFATLIGIANSAYQSIRLSFVPELVSVSNMPKAVAINAILYNTSRFVGPMVAGFLMLRFGNEITLFVVAACYLPLTFVLCLIKVPVKLISIDKEFTFFEDIKAGVKYAYNSTLISQLLVVIGISALLGRGLLEILPATVDVIYNMGVQELAWLNSAVGVGSIISALMLTNPTQTKLMRAVTIGSIGSGALLILFMMTSQFVIGLLIIGGLGFCATLCGVGTQSLIQSTVPSEFRGRVMSLWGSINLGVGAIGGLLFGVMTEYFGYPTSLVTLGSLCILCAYISTKKGQTVRRDKSVEDWR